MHTARLMTIHTRSQASRHCIALLSVLTLASCSGPADKDDRTAGNDAGYQILPAAPLAANELRLAYGLNPVAMGNALTAAGGGEESGFIWSVNGQKVGRGLSLGPGLFRRRDRVSVRLEPDDISVERAFVIIGNSPPEIYGVSVRRDTDNPDLAVAEFSAADPDGDRIVYEFEWSVDGTIVENADGFELRVDNRSRGQEILVKLRVSDDELTVSRTSSPARLENHAPELSVASLPQILESDDGRWAELGISASDADGDALEIEVTGDHVSFDEVASVMRWELAEGTEEFAVTVRVSDPTGGTAERELRLKR
jgi:hypothetical protein